MPTLGEPVSAVAVRSALSLRSIIFEGTTMSRFTDVATTYQFAGEALRFDVRDVTPGCTTTGSCPTTQVTRGEMAIFMARALAIG